jgi:hypothetical protein
MCGRGVSPFEATGPECISERLRLHVAAGTRHRTESHEGKDDKMKKEALFKAGTLGLGVALALSSFQTPVSAAGDTCYQYSVCVDFQQMLSGECSTTYFQNYGSGNPNDYYCQCADMPSWCCVSDVQLPGYCS